jgi:hypothetical protein
MRGWGLQRRGEVEGDEFESVVFELFEFVFCGEGARRALECFVG